MTPEYPMPYSNQCAIFISHILQKPCNITIHIKLEERVEVCSFLPQSINYGKTPPESNTYYVLAQYAILICSVTQEGGNCLGISLMD